MEVMGSPPMDHFDFNYDSRILPYLSAPSSPKRFGEIYMSAPTSPSRISEFYREFEYFSISSPTPYEKGDYEEDGFAFSVEESQKSPRSAEELFDGGRIKPLKNNNELLLMESAKSPLLLSPERSNSPRRSALNQGKKAIREAFSPRKNTNITTNNNNNDNNSSFNDESRRGRDRTPSIIASNSSRRRATRSHSPYREHHYSFDDESQHKQQQSDNNNNNSNNKEDAGVAVTKGSVLSATSASSKSSRKWRLRDFLLFRSASEGRGSSKDPFRKYPILFKKAEEGKGGSSFRSSENNNNNNNAAPRSRRKEHVSAHELHYARKKAETEDLKKRTFLPYKQGILGRLAGFTR